jgi:hypothetical protein
MGHGHWITRSPSIRKDEWRAFVASRADLNVPNSVFGEMPRNSESLPNVPEFVWWAGRLPVKVVYSAGDVFVEAAGPEAAEFATQIAAYFGGVAQEA